MTMGELMDAFRARAFDTVVPYLWSDDEVREYADDAENEAAERARLLRDSTTAEICEVEVVADTAAYILDSRILSVERAKLDLGSSPLSLTSTPAMDAENGRWESCTGTPSRMVLDAEQGTWKATLNPTPQVNDTLRLQVYRLPIALLSTDESNIPEIHPRLHIRLVDWMMARAYRKQDAETRDELKAQEHEAIFESAFGRRIDANVRRKQEDLVPSVVQFREF